MRRTRAVTLTALVAASAMVFAACSSSPGQAAPSSTASTPASAGSSASAPTGSSSAAASAPAGTAAGTVGQHGSDRIRRIEHRHQRLRRAARRLHRPRRGLRHDHHRPRRAGEFLERRDHPRQLGLQRESAVPDAGADLLLRQQAQRGEQRSVHQVHSHEEESVDRSVHDQQGRQVVRRRAGQRLRPAAAVDRSEREVQHRHSQERCERQPHQVERRSLRHLGSGCGADHAVSRRSPPTVRRSRWSTASRSSTTSSSSDRSSSRPTWSARRLSGSPIRPPRPRRSRRPRSRTTRRALAKIANFWNTGFDFTQLPTDKSLYLSSGAYLLTAFKKDQYMTFTANPDYTWGPKPTVKTITYEYLPDATAAVQSMQNQEVAIIEPAASDHRPEQGPCGTGRPGRQGRQQCQR